MLTEWKNSGGEMEKQGYTRKWRRTLSGYGNKFCIQEELELKVTQFGSRYILENSRKSSLSTCGSLAVCT
jgi:hypothetical protein